MADTFLRQKGNYRDLIVFRKATCIFDVTNYFANRYYRQGDRTIDQMVQAARSGRQNIAEGCEAGTTSAETEIKLVNVAKASLQELLLDYEDYLRVRGLELWATSDPRYEQTRRVCATHNDPDFYVDAAKGRSDETVANIVITLIHQADTLLRRLIDRLQEDFVREGGIKEQMYRARVAHRSGEQG